MQDFVAILSNITKLNNHVYLYRFELDHDITFVPGQFVNFIFSDAQGKFARAYSISGFGDDAIIARNKVTTQELEFIIEILENGRASNVFANAKEGDSFAFKAPGGKFILQPDFEGRSTLLLATGTGIAPMKCISDFLSYCDLSRPTNVMLFHGLRYLEDRYLEEYFQNLSNIGLQNFIFKYSLYLSKAEQGTFDNVGRIQKGLDLLSSDDIQGCDIYICGNKDAVLDINEYCKSRCSQLDTSRIYFERFN